MMRTWTLSDLRRVNTFTAAAHDYEFSDVTWGRDKANDLCTLPWLWIILAQRLTWLYGETGALARLNTPIACAA